MHKIIIFINVLRTASRAWSCVLCCFTFTVLKPWEVQVSTYKEKKRLHAAAWIGLPYTFRMKRELASFFWSSHGIKKGKREEKTFHQRYLMINAWQKVSGEKAAETPGTSGLHLQLFITICLCAVWHNSGEPPFNGFLKSYLFMMCLRNDTDVVQRARTATKSQDKKKKKAKKRERRMKENKTHCCSVNDLKISQPLHHS